MNNGVAPSTPAEWNYITERFVDADDAAKFLGITRRRVLELVRAGEIPGYPSTGSQAENVALPLV